MSSRGRHQRLVARKRRKRSRLHAGQEWGNAWDAAVARYREKEAVVMAALQAGGLADAVRALHAHMDAQQVQP